MKKCAFKVSNSTIEQLVLASLALSFHIDNVQEKTCLTKMGLRNELRLWNWWQLRQQSSDLDIHDLTICNSWFCLDGK